MLSVGFLIKARTELVWYGLEMPTSKAEDLVAQYHSVEEVTILDMYHDFFNGFAVGPEGVSLAANLEILYFFPQEEDAVGTGADRIVDLNRVQVITRYPRRKKCDPGWVYVCGGDVGREYVETKHFQSGFLPPFKPEDLTLIVEDLTDFGYPGRIVRKIQYCGQDEEFSETESFGTTGLPSRILLD